MGSPTQVAVGDLSLVAGNTYAFYVHLASYPVGHTLMYTNGSTSYENNDLRISAGIGKDDEAFTGTNFTPRIWNGTIHYDLGPWNNLGFALAGTSGFPFLGGIGSLLPGTFHSFTLHDARPFATTFLIVGVGTWYVPYKGGTWVPSLDLFIKGTTSAAGTHVISGIWPSNLPQGFSLYYQHWIIDPVGVKGWAASNAVQATAQ